LVKLSPDILLDLHKEKEQKENNIQEVLLKLQAREGTDARYLSSPAKA
jgi:hypothetical protein